MKSFEATFLTEYDDGYSAGSGGQFMRIILSSDIHTAWRIARAMLGEEVNEGMWLSEFLSIQTTSAPPRMSGFIDNAACWQRVVEKLSLAPESFRLIYNWKLNNEIVGLVFWPPEK